MGLLDRFRHRRLPAGAQPALDPGEHIVSWAAADGGHLVATNRGLWLPGRDTRLGWHQIHKATWSGRELTILPGRVVHPAGTAPDAPADVVADDDPVRHLLPDPGDLPHQVRLRVTGSVAHTSHHALPNGGVRILARRVSGVDGVTWALRYDERTTLAGSDHDLVATLLVTARTEFQS